MNMERWVNPRVKGVRVASQWEYPEASGWKRKPFPRP